MNIPSAVRQCLACLSLSLSCFSLISQTHAQEGEHLIGAGDLVDIKVYGEPDLDSAKVLVSKEGRVSVQLIGEVEISNLTAAAAARAIEAKLQKGYLVHPKVTLNVSGIAQKRLTVLGQVNKSGAYNFPAGQKLTLSEAIGMAQGYNKSANPKKITIRRPGVTDPIKLDGTKQGEFEIKPGDVINIDESVW